MRSSRESGVLPTASATEASARERTSERLIEACAPLASARASRASAARDPATHRARRGRLDEAHGASDASSIVARDDRAEAGARARSAAATSCASARPRDRATRRREALLPLFADLGQAASAARSAAHRSRRAPPAMAGTIEIGIAGLELGLEPVEEADVLLADVDVDEAAHALLVEQAIADAGVASSRGLR